MIAAEGDLQICVELTERALTARPAELLTAVDRHRARSRARPGVRGIALHAGDVLVGEWDIAVLGPHYAGALVARDLGDDGPDLERCFE